MKLRPRIPKSWIIGAKWASLASPKAQGQVLLHKLPIQLTECRRSTGSWHRGWLFWQVSGLIHQAINVLAVGSRGRCQSPGRHNGGAVQYGKAHVRRNINSYANYSKGDCGGLSGSQMRLWQPGKIRNEWRLSATKNRVRIRVRESLRRVQNINRGLDNTLTSVFNYPFYDSDDGRWECFTRLTYEEDSQS